MAKTIKVKKLVLYPVKSMSGIDVPYLQCTNSGFQYDGIGDRHWIVSTASGIGLSGRQQPRLVLIKPSIHGNMLHLDADGMETLKVPRDISADGRQKRTMTLYMGRGEGVDCGDEASQWLSKFMGKEGLRLLYAEKESDGLCLKDCSLVAPLANENDKTVYHDCFPGLLLSETSLEDLNSRLEKPVNMDRFRGNIIVSGTDVPYIEDEWKQIKIGETILTGAISSPRCQFPAVDPSTGVKDKDVEPIRTLKTYRVLKLPECLKNIRDLPCFGLWLTTPKPGIIRVGDTIATTKEKAL